MSPAHDQVEINQNPPLLYPTFYLFTQSPSYATKHLHSVQESETHQAPSVQSPCQQQTTTNKQQPPAQQQQPLVDQVPPVQTKKQHQQVPPVQVAQQQQVAPAQAAQHPQQPVQREHIMQLRTCKHFDRDCGTKSKMEIRPYKRRHLV